MLLTITSTTPPATDLGYLLHKNPNRAQTVKLGFGQATVFYPEASEERCTAALLLDVDPVGLVRGRGRSGGSDQDGADYVSDRPYVASSFLSVAIGELFGTALAGRSRERPELAATALPLEARLSVVPARGGEATVRRLFEPLGYDVEARTLPLDETYPAWGDSPYHVVTLRATCRLRDLLTHLTVLIPVLDDRKHYFVGDDEIEKLLRRGEGWLPGHPARSLIAERYLKHQRGLIRSALDRLEEDEANADDGLEEIEAELARAALVALDGGSEDRPGLTEAQADADAPEALTDVGGVAASAPDPTSTAISGTPVRYRSLHDRRIEAVLAALNGAGARSVLDLGCGEGRLLRELLADSSFERIVGLDVSYRALERARARLRLDRLPPRQTARISLLHGALTYRDRRLAGFDAAAVVEVVEHLDPPRLAAFERVLFEHARPATVVLTTPNVEHNVRYPGLAEGGLRHTDHRFEWTRAEFQAWASRVADQFGYCVAVRGVGDEDSEVGAPSQLAVFSR